MDMDAVPFSQVKKSVLTGCVPLTDRLNTSIVIKAFETHTFGNLGEVAIITTVDGQKLYTFSRTVINQLREIENILLEKPVIATIKKKKRYITLE